MIALMREKCNQQKHKRYVNECTQEKEKDF